MKKNFASGIALCLIYIAAAELGVWAGALSGFAGPTRLPTGISLAALFLFGPRLWPAVALAALVVNATQGMPLWAAGGVAAGNTLEVILGAVLLRKARVHPALDRIRDVWIFVVIGGILSTSVGATIGTASLWLGELVSASAALQSWLLWWLGGLSSNLLVAPLILVWAARPRVTEKRENAALEAVVLVALLVMTCAAVFFDTHTMPFLYLNRTPVYFTFPFVIWAALRFGQHGAVSTAFIVSVASIWGTSLGLGPYAEAKPSAETMASLVLFRSVAAVTAMILAAIVMERERAHEREKKWASVVENANWGMAVGSGEANTIEMINRTFAEMHGRAARELIGQPFAMLYPAAHRSEASEHLRQINERGHHIYESVHARGDGRCFPVMIDASSIRDASGRVRYRAMYVQDISEKKIAEERLRRLLLELEASVRVRDEFIAIASHELKTPITTLKLQTQMTERSINKSGVALIDPQVLLRQIKQANRQMDRLSSLVDAMLDTSRIDSGTLVLHCESLDLVDLVTAVRERLFDDAGEGATRVTVDAESEVRGRWDRFRLEQVVTNLLSNASKYGEGEPIEIRVRNRSADSVAIIVHDHGIGIEKKDHVRIFERFERAVPSVNITGFGLGLFIVKRLVEAHGGSIEVKSEPGNGATFCVVLPRFCNFRGSEESDATA